MLRAEEYALLICCGRPVVYCKIENAIFFLGDVCVNSSDEEEEFDPEDIPKVTRKKPPADAEETATVKHADSQKTESNEQASSAAEPKHTNNVRL